MMQANDNTDAMGMRWIFALFPIIMMILDPYAVSEGGSIFICDILVIIMGAYFILTKQVKLYIPLFILMIVDIVLTIVSFAFTSSGQTDMLLAIKVGAVFMLYLLVYSGIWSVDVKTEFFKLIEIIGIICAILAILQFVFSSLGFEFYDGKLFLPLGEGSYFGGLYDSNTNDLRVHSFFEEPSYLAFFEIPITVHFIQEKKYLKASICALSCILSGAMTGIVGLIIAICAVLILDSEIEKKHKAYFVAIVIAALIVAVYFYNSNSSFKLLIDYYINRGQTIDISSQRADSSFSQRIIGNSELFSEYGVLNKFIGVGFNQYSLYFEVYKDYSNDFVSNLLNFGYIGIITMILTLLIMLRNTSGHGRVFWVIFIILLAVDHSWFGPMFFYMVTWIMMKSENEDYDSKFVIVRY